MTKQIFRSIFATALIVFAASFVIILGVLYNYFTKVQMEQLTVETHMAAQGVELEGEDYLESLETDEFRVTWIDEDGTVLFESSDISEEQMENHLEREEVQEALADGYGESKRYSSTVLEKALYAAQQLSDGTVIRLSISQKSVLKLIYGMLQPIIFLLAVVIFLSLFLAYRLAKNIVRPLNELDLEKPLENVRYDELSPVLHRIASQQRQLKWQQLGLEQKENELDTIINGMSDGMILLGTDHKILSINQAALRILHETKECVGRDILMTSRNRELHKAIERASEGVSASLRTVIDGCVYEVNAAPVQNNEEISGIVLLLFDITEKEKAEQMRREFTANVSHELKTPLTSISGYAELLAGGLVQEDDKKPFYGKIYDEAQHMKTLINDIIDLSHLDEGAAELEKADVDLEQIARACITELTTAAEAMQVSVSLESEPAVIRGVPQQVKSIVFNLIENAIKYNREQGSVEVIVQSSVNEAVLRVRDTGIGIPPEDQKRIFERFYRVDKSRSKEIGGTGLGLSIVKHAALIHNAKIDLKSKVGKGTEFTVIFPKDSAKNEDDYDEEDDENRD